MAAALRRTRQRRTQSDRVKEQRLMKHRFRVPIAKLSLNVANFAVLSLPVVVYQTASVVMGTKEFLQWYTCVGLRRDLYYMTVWETVLRCSVQLRVVVDVLVGLRTDAELRRSLPSLLSLVLLTRRDEGVNRESTTSYGTTSTACPK